MFFFLAATCLTSSLNKILLLISSLVLSSEQIHVSLQCACLLLTLPSHTSLKIVCFWVLSIKGDMLLQVFGTS